MHTLNEKLYQNFILKNKKNDKKNVSLYTAYIHHVYSTNQENLFCVLELGTTMDNLRAILHAVQAQPFATSVVLGGLSLLLLLFLRLTNKHSKLPPVPGIINIYDSKLH